MLEQMMRCDGWWEQHGYGRQEMQNLLISFAEGRIVGSGEDAIGAFTFTGTLVDDRVAMIKQYMGAHRIDYLGIYDGEGTMHGTWRFGPYEGQDWLIRIVARADPASRESDEGIPEWAPQ